jgi:hypothetical protein
MEGYFSSGDIEILRDDDQDNLFLYYHPLEEADYEEFLPGVWVQWSPTDSMIKGVLVTDCSKSNADIVQKLLTKINELKND